HRFRLRRGRRRGRRPQGGRVVRRVRADGDARLAVPRDSEALVEAAEALAFVLQSLDIAPLPLRGPALPLVAERRSDTELVGEALAHLLVLRILFVQRVRDDRRPTARREPAHRNVILERPPAHAYPVTHLHRLRPLGAGAVQLDLAAVAGLRRQGPRLEEARGPEPGVEEIGRASCRERGEIWEEGGG